MPKEPKHFELETWEVRSRGRKETFLASRPLVQSLYKLKESCTETHTKDNIQSLLDIIDKLNPTL